MVSMRAFRSHNAPHAVLQAFDLLGLNDERALPRIPCRIPIVYRVRRDAAIFDRTVFKANAVNLSPGGLCLQTVLPHTAGTMLTLISGFRVSARVVYSRPAPGASGWFTGVAFVNSAAVEM